MTKRVYEEINRKDGFRVLVDRVWPRGLTKEQVHADLWLKDVAPSTSLRKWFNHDESKWDEFRKRYFRELDNSQKSILMLINRAAKGRLTLLYSAKNTKFNQAVALKDYLMTVTRKHR